jgi:hypothetical protein
MTCAFSRPMLSRSGPEELHVVQVDAGDDRRRSASKAFTAS